MTDLKKIMTDLYPDLYPEISYSGTTRLPVVFKCIESESDCIYKKENGFCGIPTPRFIRYVFGRSDCRSIKLPPKPDDADCDDCEYLESFDNYQSCYCTRYDAGLKCEYKSVALQEPNVSPYKYYLLYRPVSFGTQPRGMIGFFNFISKSYVEEIGKFAYGYVLYENPLSEEEIKNYELAEVKK